MTLCSARREGGDVDTQSAEEPGPIRGWPTADIAIDAIARRLIERYETQAVDVALAIVRQVNFQLHVARLLAGGSRAVASAQAREPSDPVSVVIQVVCAYFEISELDLRGDSVDRRTAGARLHAYAMLRARTIMSLSEIGSVFRRHHTTVRTGCAKVDRAGTVWRELNRRCDEALR